MAGRGEVVEGALPDWLAGDYVRNGPGLFEARGFPLPGALNAFYR